MKEIITFSTMKELEVEIDKRQGTWRSLHIDKTSSGFAVTFVNGEDDPINSPESKIRQDKFQRYQELRGKLMDDSIKFNELKEYLRYDQSR